MESCRAWPVAKSACYLFSARDDIFPELASHVSVIRIPSLFEREDKGDAFLENQPTQRFARLILSGI